MASDYDVIEPEQLDENHFRFRICLSLSVIPGSYSIRGHAMDPQGIRLCDTAEIRFTVAGESREMGMIRLPHQWNPKK